MKGVIFHYGLFKIIWDWFVLLLVLYTAVEVPFVVAFMMEDESSEKSSSKFTNPCLTLISIYLRCSHQRFYCIVYICIECLNACIHSRHGYVVAICHILQFKLIELTII